MLSCLCHKSFINILICIIFQGVMTIEGEFEGILETDVILRGYEENQPEPVVEAVTPKKGDISAIVHNKANPFGYC